MMALTAADRQHDKNNVEEMDVVLVYTTFKATAQQAKVLKLSS